MTEIGLEKQGRLNLEFWKDIEGWDGFSVGELKSEGREDISNLKGIT